MKPLKISLAGLVVLLAIAVGYGYGCGGSDDDKGGSGDTTAAAEADGTPSSAASTESGDGDGAPEDNGNGGDGNGGGGGDGNGAPTSKASYIKQGDVICEKVPRSYAQTVTTMEEGNGNETPSPAEVNLKAAVPPLYTAIEEFEGMSPPSGDEQQIDEIIDALSAAAKGLKAKPTSELSGPKSPFAEFQKLSRAYGFKFCARL